MKKNIPPYIKWNDEKNDPRQIPDGMSDMGRNMKRLNDMYRIRLSYCIFACNGCLLYIDKT